MEPMRLPYQINQRYLTTRPSLTLTVLFGLQNVKRPPHGRPCYLNVPQVDSVPDNLAMRCALQDLSRSVTATWLHHPRERGAMRSSGIRAYGCDRNCL